MTNAEQIHNRIQIGDRVSISPRGKRGIYTAEFNRNGQHCHRSLKTSNLKVARQRAIKLESDLASGDYAAPVKPVAVAEARRRYIDSLKANSRARKTVIAYDAETKLFVELLAHNGVQYLSQINTALRRLPVTPATTARAENTLCPLDDREVVSELVLRRRRGP